MSIATSVMSGTGIVTYPYIKSEDVVTACFVREVGMLLVLVCVALKMTEQSLVTGMRREAEVNASRNEQSALNSLLNLMCDAAVELDFKLDIVRHVPALSTMLLHEAGKSLQGMTLQHLMPSSDDQQRVDDAINSAPGNNAQVLHSKVYDSLCNELRMELFHIPFPNIDGHTHHLIGLREHTDFKSRDNVSCMASTILAQSKVSGSSDVNDGITDIFLNSDSSTPSENPSDIDLESGAAHIDEIAFTITDEDGLSVISGTPGFTCLMGPFRYGQPLEEWIECNSIFGSKVQTLGNMFNSLCKIGKLVLRPPSAITAGIEYAVRDCTVDFISRGDEK